MHAEVKIVIDTVSEVFGVPVQEILGDRRSRNRTIARLAAYSLARSLVPQLSWPDLGEILGRNHTTLITGTKSHLRRCSCDEIVARLTDNARALAASRLEARLSAMEQARVA